MGKKISQKKSRQFVFIFFISIIVYIMYKAIFGFFITEPKIEVANYGQLLSQKEYDCLIVRKENVIRSPGEGNVKYFVNEGERVEKGQKILEIYKTSVNEKDREKLVELHNRIDKINSNKENIFEVDIEKINKEINYIINEIKRQKSLGNYDKIEELTKELKNKIDKQRRISGDKSFAGHNLENLKNEKEKLENIIESSIMEVNALEPGIISYNIDGIEEIITPYNLAKIKYDYIKSLDIDLSKLKLEKAIYDQPIFKIVDNSKWYVVVITTLEDSNTFRKNQKIAVDIYDSKISGYVAEILKNDKKSLVVIETTQYAKNFYKDRKLKLNIIKEEYNGLKIHRDSIVEKNGQAGVLALDINKRATFKPIKIKGYNDVFAIIYNNFYNIREGNDIKRVKTVKLYDEILRKGNKYKEGEIIY